MHSALKYKIFALIPALPGAGKHSLPTKQLFSREVRRYVPDIMKKKRLQKERDGCHMQRETIHLGYDLLPPNLLQILQNHKLCTFIQYFVHLFNICIEELCISYLPKLYTPFIILLVNCYENRFTV